MPLRESSPESLHAGSLRVLDAVLAIVHERRGTDFTGYRRGTLERRLANRMVAANAGNADEYVALLATSEPELDRLTANFTIKVSRFYRNAPVFDALREESIPALRAEFPGEGLRAWSAGCASGEEAYTLAAILGDGGVVRATDIDESALAVARRGIYATDSLIETPEEVGRQLGSKVDGKFIVADAIRDRVAFERHDLATAVLPPEAGRYHLVCCRNVLIYFSRPLQQHAMRLLIEALVPGGILCLGEAEWLVDAGLAMEVVDRKRKLFRRPGSRR